ncbi:MAG: DUF452 family protein [Muribaculaceae bacterium]|nr:DUF452 family protein [Muribaculaceae bacterium]
MYLEFVDRKASDRLVLIFAGWATGPRLFSDVSIAGYDTAVAYDYTDLEAPWISQLGRYKEIAVVAWSYGVPSASQFMLSHKNLPITARIAVNSTLYPADEERGIPPTIFNATAQRLSEATLRKFMMRMCGGGARYAHVESKLTPGRDIDALRRELTAIGERQPSELVWDHAIVADSDLIIPTSAQLRAWEGNALQTEIISGAHLPDFTTLLSGLFTDKDLVRQRFGKADTTYDDNAVVQHEIADCLLQMLPPPAPHGENILEIGAGTGHATARLVGRKPASLTVWDLHITPSVRAIEGVTTVQTDAETAIKSLPDSSVSMIFSASTVQWFNSLPEFLREGARVLRPGGIMALSTFGPATMREVTGGVSRFPTAETILKMIPSEIEILRFIETTRTLLFDTPLDVLRHISSTGVNALDGGDSARLRALRLMKHYPLRADGCAPLTYQPIFIVLQRK